ncbi:MAG: GPR endopeptidase [Oscillospiraceae bacterium]|jgi:spore protease|nr:GPR endopeptidase [Oscillospiraceae bacterium]
MRQAIRTDLAIEGAEFFRESAGETTKLDGVEAREYDDDGFTVHEVTILNEVGAAAIGKPIGRYVSVDVERYVEKRDNAFSDGVGVIARIVRDLLRLSRDSSVLVVGLGNPAITPDDLGPRTTKGLIVTRHLLEQIPLEFADFRKVAALDTGVLGTTGIESLELVRAVVDAIAPDAIIAVDSLVSRSLTRLCRTVQVNDSGIVPGSGVGNARLGLNAATVGVPVIAIGVPTVVAASTMIRDALERAGSDPDSIELQLDMIVTPKDIDAQIRDLGKLLAYALNLALHDDLSEDDVTAFLA